MNPWQANLQALEGRHPEVAAQLASLSDAPSRGDWAPSRQGPLWVRRDGVSWASSFDPVAEAHRAVPEWPLGIDFAVLTTIGAGYLLEGLVARYPELPLVVAEPDLEWFAEVLRHRDLRPLWKHDRLIVLVGERSATLADQLEAFPCTRVEIVRWRPASQSRPDWDAEVDALVARAQARSGVNLATYARFGDLWRRNLGRNEAQVPSVRAVASLTRAWAGRTAVVVGAGPSLADAFPWLLAHRHQFGLIAVDTSWPALAARGIEPDVVLVLDAQYWNGRHLDRPLPERTSVVTEWTAPPRAFRIAPRRTYVAASSLPILRARESRLWGPLGELPSGGSVGTAAWSLALLLGADRVILAGLDLGYPLGQTHVPGSQFEEALHRNSRRLVPAETRALALWQGPGRSMRPSFDGGRVASDARMDLFRRWLELDLARHPEVKVWTLGPRGSALQGVEVLDPDAPFDQPSWDFSLTQGDVLRRAETQDHGVDRVPLNHFVETGDPQGIEAAWKAGSEIWGPSVWMSWTARALRAWNRFPSPRTLENLRELARIALEWERFGT